MVKFALNTRHWCRYSMSPAGIDANIRNIFNLEIIQIMPQPNENHNSSGLVGIRGLNENRERTEGEKYGG